MKREVTFCDVCGSQMTYTHVDGDHDDAGFFLSAPLDICVKTRTDCGSSSSVVFRTTATEYCSVKCIETQLTAALEQIRKHSPTTQHTRS